MLGAVDEMTADDRMFARPGRYVDLNRGVGGGELRKMVLEEEAGWRGGSVREEKGERLVVMGSMYFMPFELPAQSQ